MIIDTTEAPVLFATSSNAQEMSFGIQEKDVSHVIMLLRQNLYSDPIGALCREVASNSRDANRESGKGDVPIRISIGKNPFLPSTDCISFEDNGPGISETRMSEVFICYGASTKRGTNEMTGGFGLGAKTPFAYSNHFLIETCSEGTHFIYQALIASGNRGRMVLLSKNTYEGEAPFGTRVVVPIKHSDIREFEDKCYKATYFWDVQPVYEGFDIIREMQLVEEIPYFKNGSIRILRHTDRAYNVDFIGAHRIGLLLDGIPYPLEQGVSEFQDTLISSLNRFSSNDHIYIYLTCKPGEVSLAPSREHLHYDDKTKAYIKGVINELKDEITVRTMSFLHKFPSIASAVAFSSTHEPSYVKKVVLGEGTLEEGMTVETAHFWAFMCYNILTREKFLDALGGEGFGEKFTKLHGYSVSFSLNHNVDYPSCRCSKTSRPIHHPLTTPGNTEIVIVDTFGYNGSRNYRWDDYVRMSGNRVFFISTYRGKGLKKDAIMTFPPEEMRKFLESFGYTNIRMYSEMSAKYGGKRLAKPKKIQVNCSVVTQNYQFSDAHVTLKDKKVIITYQDHRQEEVSLAQVIPVAAPQYGQRDLRTLMADLNFQKKLEGSTDTFALGILFQNSELPVYQGIIKHNKVVEGIKAFQGKVSSLVKGKTFTKEVTLLRQKEYLQERSLPMLLVEMDLPHTNKLYEVIKEYRKILAFQPSQKTLALLDGRSSPDVNWHSEVLEKAEKILRENPLGSILLGRLRFETPEEFLMEFTKFIKTFYQKEKVVCPSIQTSLVG
jgi:hypothetical protein